MLGHFVPQEPAQAGGLLGELLRGARRLGFPEEEVAEQFEERLRAAQGFASRLDLAFQVNVCDEFPIVPQAERIAVGVDQIRE